MFLHQQLVKFAGFIAVGCTLVINPWFAYDPINLPKMLVLTTGATFLGCALIFNLRNLRSINKWFLFLFGSLFFFLTLSVFINSAPLSQQILGTWGRSTGYLTYISFLLITLSVAIFARKQDFSTLRVYLERLSYFISFYTIVQWADLDPINWSQKLMVATLGNLNFMSSFLGIASCSFLVRTVLEKTPLSSRLFFTFMTAVNLLLIYVSGSIQGIAIFAAGIAQVISILVRRRYGVREFIYSLVAFIFLGVLTFIGTVGQGPLAMFKQETVLYRLDYWRAGWKMSISHPLFGVGIDSYGDFYRQFRDLAAVERTGPQRVTNTAHNIFLDVSSGAGFVAGISFFLIIFLVVLLMLRKIIRDALDEDTIAWTLILVGFLIFCLISINQIGVGIWGFIALGLLINSLTKPIEDSSVSHKSIRGVTGSKLSRETHKLLEHEKPGNFRVKKVLLHSVTLICTCATLSLTMSANLTDAKFLAAFKSNDLVQAYELTKGFTAMDFHKEVLVSRLSTAGSVKESLDLATEIVERNPQNWVAWVTIVKSDSSSVAQKEEAVKRLSALDPNNRAVRDELTAILESISTSSR